jgi:hypothetical protein
MVGLLSGERTGAFLLYPDRGCVSNGIDGGRIMTGGQGEHAREHRPGGLGCARSMLVPDRGQGTVERRDGYLSDPKTSD